MYARYHLPASYGADEARLCGISLVYVSRGGWGGVRVGRGKGQRGRGQLFDSFSNSIITRCTMCKHSQCMSPSSPRPDLLLMRGVYRSTVGIILGINPPHEAQADGKPLSILISITIGLFAVCPSSAPSSFPLLIFLDWERIRRW